MNNDSVRALKYAQAFLSVYGTILPADQLESLHALERYLIESSTVSLLCTMPLLTDKKKCECIRVLLDTCGLHESFSNLIQLLITNKAIALLREVVRHIIRLYKQKNALVECVISVSHPISQATCEIIKQFIARKTGKNVLYTVVVDKDLIAGIRVHSETFVWQYSIAHQLRLLRSGIVGV